MTQQALPLTNWLTGPRERRDGHRYVHLIRGESDPVRAPRPKGGQTDRAPHLTIAKTPASAWAGLLRALLADKRPRTFNAIALELFGVTADVAFETPLDVALWGLVAAGVVEHTARPPIVFRLALP